MVKVALSKDKVTVPLHLHVLLVRHMQLMIEFYDSFKKIEEVSWICVLYTHDILEEVSAITQAWLYCAVKKVYSEGIAERKRFANPNHVLTFRLGGMV